MEQPFDLQLGTREIWGTRHAFGLSEADRFHHTFIVGQTGVGKSSLLRQMILQDVLADRGVALIEPHGDLVDDILDYIPLRRRNDVVILDPSDTEHVVTINPFYNVPLDERALVAANFVAAMKHIWGDSWGARLEWILYNAVAATLDAPSELRPTLLSIPLILANDTYRRKIVSHIKDRRVASFFADEFGAWSERQRAEYVTSIQNKIGQVIANPFIRNTLVPWRPTVNIPALIEQNAILLVRLPKGRLGAEPANLIGSLIIATIVQAAMRRQSQPYEERAGFHLVIDELHNFVSSALAPALSELRKYKCSICAASQYLEAIDPTLRSAIFGNVGNLIAFRTSSDDAEHLARAIGEYNVTTFRDLPRGQVCARLTEDGMPQRAFIGETLMQEYPREDGREQIIRYCRERHARPRAVIEGYLALWFDNALEPKTSTPKPTLERAPKNRRRKRRPRDAMQ